MEKNIFFVKLIFIFFIKLNPKIVYFNDIDNFIQDSKLCVIHTSIDLKDGNNLSKKEKNDYEKISLVIFIHGTVSGIHTYGLPNGPSLSLRGTCSYMREAFWSILKKGKEIYKKLYESPQKFALYRNREAFFANDKLPVIIGIIPGLIEICTDEFCSLVDCTVTAHKNIVLPFVKSFERNKNEEDTLFKYYIFNWIGDLSSMDRTEAARILRNHLLKEIKKYKDKKIEISIFAFSHGGNVLLEAFSDTEVLIDLVVLMGTPIGKKTIKWLERSNIGKLFNFFSYTDMIQKADFLFNFPYFSWRKISRTPYMNKIEKIFNIAVSLSENGIKKPFKHHYFYLMSPQFIFPLMCYLPQVVTSYSDNRLQSLKLKIE